MFPLGNFFMLKADGQIDRWRRGRLKVIRIYVITNAIIDCELFTGLNFTVNAHVPYKVTLFLPLVRVLKTVWKSEENRFQKCIKKVNLYVSLYFILK